MALRGYPFESCALVHLIIWRHFPELIALMTRIQVPVKTSSRKKNKHTAKPTESLKICRFSHQNHPPRFLHPVTFLPLTKNCFAVAAYILARFQARNHNKRGSQNGSTWQRHERPTDIWSTSTAYILSKCSPKTVAVGTAKTHRPRPQQYRKALLDSPWARRLHCQWKDKHGHQNRLIC